MLRVNDIQTYYGDSHVLQGISLRMESGQVVGPSFEGPAVGVTSALVSPDGLRVAARRYAITRNDSSVMICVW